MSALSEWLSQQLKKQKHLNQTGLAISLQVGPSTVSNWLRGISTPQPENCRKIARYFNVPEHNVLTIAGHEPIIIGEDHGADTPGHVAESRTPYHLSPRARLDLLLDELDDTQIEALATFLETL